MWGMCWVKGAKLCWCCHAQKVVRPDSYISPWVRLVLGPSFDARVQGEIFSERSFLSLDKSILRPSPDLIDFECGRKVVLQTQIFFQVGEKWFCKLGFFFWLEKSCCRLKSWMLSQFLTPSFFLLSKVYVVNRMWGYHFIDCLLLKKSNGSNPFWSSILIFMHD